MLRKSIMWVYFRGTRSSGKLIIGCIYGESTFLTIFFLQMFQFFVQKQKLKCFYWRSSSCPQQECSIFDTGVYFCGGVQIRVSPLLLTFLALEWWRNRRMNKHLVKPNNNSVFTCKEIVRSLKHTDKQWFFCGFFTDTDTLQYFASTVQRYCWLTTTNGHKRSLLFTSWWFNALHC